MANYFPKYDTTIRTSTVTQNHSTMHCDSIDWDNYPFDDPEHFHGMCCSLERKLEHLQELMQFLRICEQNNVRTVYASNYGGWPRIWKRVLWSGMASVWPYWSPRPTVCIDGTLGPEYVDWTSITAAKLGDLEEALNG